MQHSGTLRGRSLLTLDDVSDVEIRQLLDLADRLKAKKRAGRRGQLLRQKNIALIFEKSSTRTRCAFTVAAVDEGAHAEFLDLDDIHLGRKESLADTAQVLGRMFDAIAFRGYAHWTVELLARHAGVPVWNALTDEWHPTQVLADLMTVRECFGRLKGLKLVYLGDGHNNVARTLMVGCARMGMHCVVCTPQALAPPTALQSRTAALAGERGGSVAVSADPRSAVQGAHILYTDVWVSMGEETELRQRLRLLRPYQVTMALARQTGRLGVGGVIFLHCLPALHDRHTDLTRRLGALEVTDEVFAAPFSKVFEQAENRVHTIKAVMVATLTGGRRRRCAGRAV